MLPADKPEIILSSVMLLFTLCIDKFIHFSVVVGYLCDCCTILIVFSMQIEETFGNDRLYLCENIKHTLARLVIVKVTSVVHAGFDTFSFCFMFHVLFRFFFSVLFCLIEWYYCLHFVHLLHLSIHLVPYQDSFITSYIFKISTPRKKKNEIKKERRDEKTIFQLSRAAMNETKWKYYMRHKNFVILYPWTLNAVFNLYLFTCFQGGKHVRGEKEKTSLSFLRRILYRFFFFFLFIFKLFNQGQLGRTSDIK